MGGHESPSDDQITRANTLPNFPRPYLYQLEKKGGRGLETETDGHLVTS